MKTGSVPVHPHTIFRMPNACTWQSGSGNSVYGVVGIPMQKETLDSFEYSILLSVINECALAMENAQNAVEKEKIADFS